MTAEEKTETSAKNKTCKIKGCKRPYQAKGYCNVHYRQWCKGKLPKARYQTCNFGVNKLKRGEKKECFKPVLRKGLCAEHYQALLDKKKTSRQAEAASATAG